MVGDTTRRGEDERGVRIMGRRELKGREQLNGPPRLATGTGPSGSARHTRRGADGPADGQQGRNTPPLPPPGQERAAAAAAAADAAAFAQDRYITLGAPH